MTEDAIERRALALFEQLIDVPESQRDAWIAEHAQGDNRLAARLNAIREAARRTTMRTGGAVSTLEEEPQPERVGAYRIVERIGQGGMGSVFRGERTTGDFDHAVAIKIIKPGLLSESLVERFHRERQMLAGLRHPHIAQLYDGGATEAGSPYFVMEYVDGLPLLEWLARHDPAIEVRQRLFADICGAVAFANRALVVHRDLTPSNVLITDNGTVKLIDFGIARPVDHGGDMAASSLGSLSLTPGYAAPERMTSAEVTTAADIFSLGRLLEKMIPDSDADDELRAIVGRATATNPVERYPTADALGSDVEAWYRGFPVAAVDGQRFYVFRKFVRRNRAAVAAASLAIILLVSALVATAVAYKRAEAARLAEAERFGQLRSLAGYMLFDLNGQLERVVGNTAARADLAKRAQAYLAALAATRDADPALSLEIARGFVRLGQIQGLPTEPNLGEREAAKANLLRAERLLTSLDGHLPAVATALARARTYLAMIALHGDGDQKESERLIGLAFSGLDRLALGERNSEWRAAKAELRRSQVDMMLLSGRIDELSAHADLIASEVRGWPQAERGTLAAQFERAYADYVRGVALNHTGSEAAALPVFRRAEQQFLRLDQQSPNDPVILNALAWLAYDAYGASSAFDRDETARFLALARRTVDRLTALESQDQSLRGFSLNVRQAQAEALASDGNHPAAVALQREVIVGREAAAKIRPSPSTIGRIAFAEFVLGNIAVQSGNRTLACDSYRASAASFGKAKGLGPLLGRDEGFDRKVATNNARCNSGAMPLSVE